MNTADYAEERDWLVTLVHFRPEYPEEHAEEAEKLGYLIAYADLTNTRCLGLIGDSEGGIYEILFSFDGSENRASFMKLVAENEDLGHDFVETLSVPSPTEVEGALPLPQVIPPDPFRHACAMAQLLLRAFGEDSEGTNN
jgi:hypothetical protein